MFESIKKWFADRKKIVVIDVDESNLEPTFKHTETRVQDCSPQEQESIGEALKNSGW
jgi:hypothetical protein